MQSLTVCGHCSLHDGCVVWLVGISTFLQTPDAFVHNKTPSVRGGVLDKPVDLLRPYALEILPLLMQLVHTRMRFGAPLTSALTA